MRRITSLYLGGPDAAMPDALMTMAQKRTMCADKGFVGVFPEDSILVETDPSEAMAREIYMDRVSRMRLADAAVLNMTPWRGPNCSVSTAFEAGFMAALGKPVFAYMNVQGEDEAELRNRIENEMGLEVDRQGVWRDGFGGLIEDFGLPEDLMLWAEARRLFVIATADIYGDLTGFELCLDAVKLYSD
jgi:nucleoside 2-deoxyribosyltransferase